jgi:hypothetical protein
MSPSFFFLFQSFSPWICFLLLLLPSHSTPAPPLSGRKRARILPVARPVNSRRRITLPNQGIFHPISIPNPIPIPIHLGSTSPIDIRNMDLLRIQKDQIKIHNRLCYYKLRAVSYDFEKGGGLTLEQERWLAFYEAIDYDFIGGPLLTFEQLVKWREWI